MPTTKPHTERDDPRQQQGGAQQQGGSTGTPRQHQQQPPREPHDPRDVDPDVHEKDPEGDVETGRGGRSPQVQIDRE